MPSGDDDHSRNTDRSRLTALLGESAKTKILAVMLTGSHRDLSPPEIAERADVHRSTVYDPLHDLEELGVIHEQRQVGGTSLYQLNEESPVATHLKQVEDALQTRTES